MKATPGVDGARLCRVKGGRKAARRSAGAGARRGARHSVNRSALTLSTCTGSAPRESKRRHILELPVCAAMRSAVVPRDRQRTGASGVPILALYDGPDRDRSAASRAGCCRRIELTSAGSPPATAFPNAVPSSNCSCCRCRRRASSSSQLSLGVRHPFCPAGAHHARRRPLHERGSNQGVCATRVDQISL